MQTEPVYPARGKQTEQAKPAKPPSVNSVGEALKVLYSDYLAVNQRDQSIRTVKIDRHGTANPDIWTVTVPGESATAAAHLADRLREQAAELTRLAGKLDRGNP